jgi:hypothetical protein
MPAKISETYKKQIDRLAERVGERGEALQGADPGSSKWMTPEGLTGDVVEDTEAELHDPFERDGPNEDYVEAITPETQGSAGDLIVSTMQVDTLAQMERAYRARHITRVRSVAHACGRMRAHGRDGGVWKRSHRGYLETVLRAASHPDETT